MDVGNAHRIFRGVGFQHQGMALCISRENDFKDGLVRWSDFLCDPPKLGALVKAN